MEMEEATRFERVNGSSPLLRFKLSAIDQLGHTSMKIGRELLASEDTRNHDAVVSGQANQMRVVKYIALGRPDTLSHI